MIDDDARRQEPDTMSAVPDDTMQDNAALRDELSGMRRLHALQVSLAAQADARIALQEITRLPVPSRVPTAAACNWSVHTTARWSCVSIADMTNAAHSSSSS